MDGSTHKKLTIIISSVMALGAIVGVISYVESRRIKKMKEDILVLDKEIKELEISHKQHRNETLGI